MEGMIGEIRMFGGNFAPRSWGLCQGQLLAISSNTALFSILGTTFGGDGRTSFGLPDFRGRAPIGQGRGPGLSSWSLGERAGSETVTLNVTQMPVHSHTTSVTQPVVAGATMTGKVNVSSGSATLQTATVGASIATPGSGSGRSFAGTLGFNTTAPDIALNSASFAGTVTGIGLSPVGVQVNNAGNQQAHSNIQPSLGINFIICMFGIFPSRN